MIKPSKQNKNHLLIRKAALQDIKLATQLIYESGIRDFDYLFSTSQKQALDFIQYCYPLSDDYLSYQSHLLVESEKNILGIACYYSKKDSKKLDRGHEKHIVEFYKKQSEKIFKKEVALVDYIPEPDEESIYITHLAVAEKFKRQGVMTELLLHIIKIAKKNHFKFCVLDVDIDNIKAIKLYEKLGFKKQWEKAYLIDGKTGILSNVFRMSLVI